ncbi:MAG: stage II sporulation protein M [Methanospirillaceae archaeon]|nr:stage II sporulation protein M [Methanospirillaceae archaeon]
MNKRKNIVLFLIYLLVISLIFSLGISLAFFSDAQKKPDLEYYNQTELQQFHALQVHVTIPKLSEAFPILLFLNSGVVLFLLLVPLYWIGIWWIRNDLLVPVIRLMQGTVCLLVFSLGHNTFAMAYTLYKTLPISVFLTMYIPHGIFEIPAFILAGTCSLLVVDTVRDYLLDPKTGTNPHPGEISLFMIRTIRYPLLILIGILAFAAAIECWVTPYLVKETLETVLL